MNPKFVQAQIEAQALAESYRVAMVEFQAQKVKAEAQQAVAEAARSHVDEVRRQLEASHEKLQPLIEQEQARQQLMPMLRN